MASPHQQDATVARTALSAAMRRRCEQIPVALLIAAFVVIMLRCAWVCDDAYITYRTVDNFVSGHGLVWNIGHRVQTFTHPLWMFVVSGFYVVTGEINLTVIALSVVLSTLTVLIFAARLAPTWLAAVAGLTALLLSKAFVDYSTSGLENPLTHLLLVLFLVVYFRENVKPGDLFRLGLLGGLLMLNRLDLALIVGPPVVALWWRMRSWRGIALIAAGLLPLIAWEVFAIIYYGFPFPNTAYAKLNTGIPMSDLLPQGVNYFIYSLNRDPLTPVLIAAGIATPFMLRDRATWPIAIGVVLYLAYILRIGGDFMMGRFLAAPLLIGVVLVTRSALARWPAGLWIVIGVTVLLGLSAPEPTVFSDENYGLNPPWKMVNGIVDERAFYYQNTGLLRTVHGVRGMHHGALSPELRALLDAGGVQFVDCIGFLGFCAPPGVHLVDKFALADPLLARLPVTDREPWRIGHFERDLPAGYLASLRSGENQIADPALARLHTRLERITRGPLFTRARWAAIVTVNLGRRGVKE
jgi:arabinofuranosyltransferase